MIEMAGELSGGANLTLSLMDRTQLPWEWEVVERGGQGASNTSLSSSFLRCLLADFPVAADENSGR